MRSGEDVNATTPYSSWSLEEYHRRLVELGKGHIPPFEDAVRASRAEAQEFQDRGLITNGSKVLDVGCGNGRSAVGLMERGIGGYTGLDVIRESIEFCKLAFTGLSAFEFWHLDVKNEFYNPKGNQLPEEVVFPVETDAYDAVLAGSLYTHLGTRRVCEHYLEESVRALKPGGRIFCSFFRNPPNKLTAARARTVLAECDILDIVSRHFHIYFCRGGASGGFHDQWCLFGSKRS
jgi:SAM-dependent methyltransferase